MREERKIGGKGIEGMGRKKRGKGSEEKGAEGTGGSRDEGRGNLVSFRMYWRSSCELVRNLSRILMFRPPIFFLWKSLKFLTQLYKIGSPSNSAGLYIITTAVDPCSQQACCVGAARCDVTVSYFTISVAVSSSTCG